MGAMNLLKETLLFVASKAKHLQGFEHPGSLPKSMGAEAACMSREVLSTSQDWALKQE